MADVGNVRSKQDEEHGGKPALEDDVMIQEGRFSWAAAWCMMFWIVCFICSIVMAILAYRGAAFELITYQISFVHIRNPPYGPEEQPDGALMREINVPFSYYLPQVALFYSLAASSAGLFTVCYFTNYMLLEDQGSRKTCDICKLVAVGVQVYMERTIPVILVFLFFGGWYVYATTGWATLVCFTMGSVLNIVSARLGVSMTVQGTGRLAYSMSGALSQALKLGVRTGSIGGLLSTSLALGGMAGMWLIISDTSALAGFGSGSAIVSFYLRVGGGIFAKGAEIGGDLVGEMDTEHKAEEEKRVFELQQRITELEERRKDRQKKGLDEGDDDMLDQLRMMEEEMKDVVSTLHPIDFLDAVGENICDVSGTCADLFESMVLILSTSAIIGSKVGAVPSFLSGLPFWIVASGNLGCSLVAYYCPVQDRFSARRIRWALRLNLVVVIFWVQLVQIGTSYLEWFHGSIQFETFWHFVVISMMGQFAPEVCVLFGEFFTSLDYRPVRTLATNSHLGVVQVVLQGLGQGFLSTGFPAISMVVVVMITWQLEGHFGLALLSASSVSGTGFQGGIASYGAIAANAHKIVHLTTYHSMTRHRANTCSMLGSMAAHGGNTISAVNAFSAVFNVALTLLAESYTRIGIDYQEVAGAPLSQWSQAGLVMGFTMSLLFTANTTISCLDTSKSFMRFCKQSNLVGIKKHLPFPQSHEKPLIALTSFGTVTSMRMVFNPMINTLVVPMIGGFFLGIKGQIFLISGSNVLILCFSIFLINSGESWVAARKYILFGYLKTKEGKTIGPDSKHFKNLGVGVTIGGPFEDTTGPALNNFIKFVAVFALVTGRLYAPLPGAQSWGMGVMAILASLILIAVSKCGLRLGLNFVNSVLKQRALQKAQMDAQDFDEEEDDDEEEHDDGEQAALEDA